MFLSGTFFVTADLPPIGPWLLELNPVSYAIDGVRTGLLGYAGSNLAAGAFHLLLLACTSECGAAVLFPGIWGAKRRPAAR